MSEELESEEIESEESVELEFESEEYEKLIEKENDTWNKNQHDIHFVYLDRESRNELTRRLFLYAKKLESEITRMRDCDSCVECGTASFRSGCICPRCPNYAYD